MPSESAALLLRHIRKLAIPPADTVSDRELLHRFAQRRDEDAFTVLLHRHGPMVLRICRRILPDGPDAEDAFQATFLTLARKAAAVRWHDSAAGWLYAAACNAARKARDAAARRSNHERRAPIRPSIDPLAEMSAREMLAALEEELSRLPEKYREPLVLCYLEGTAREDVAQRLGCPLGTLKGRLERGKERLRAALDRRGLSLSAVLAAALVGRGTADAAVPELLARSTLRAAILITPAAAGISLVKFAVAFVLTIGLAGVGLVGWVESSRPTGFNSPTRQQETESVGLEDSAHPTKTAKADKADALGDPLPEGATARMGTVRFRVGGHIGQVGFFPDSKVLAAASRDGGVSLWDAATGKELRRIETATSGSSIAISPNGKVLVTDYGTDLRRWDLAEGKELPPLSMKGLNAEYLLYSTDGKTLAVVGKLQPQNQNLVLFLDAETGNELHRKLGRKNYISPSLAIAPDSKTWAYADAKEKEIWLFDTRTGKEVRRLTGVDGQPRAVAFAPDGKTLASTHSGGELRFWDLATGQLEPKVAQFYTSYQMSYSPNGKVLAGDGIGPKPHLHDIATGQARYPGARSYSGNQSSVFSPDGRLLVTSGGSVIRVWDMVAEKPVWPWDGHQGDVESVDFVLNGKMLVSAALGNMGHYHLWETATGKELTELEQKHATSNSVGQAAPDKASRVGVTALVGAPDGKMLVIGSGGSGTIWLVDAATGKEIRRLEEGKNWVRGLAISANGRTIASQHVNAICVWDVSTGKKLCSIPSQVAGDGNIALSPDGKFVAQGDYFQGMIHLWDAASGKESRRWAAHQRAVYGVAFSPDGTKLVSVGDRTAVLLWDVATGKELQRMEGHEGYVRFAVFSPDGRSILTGGIDKTVRLWEVASGGERQRFVGHRSYVICGAFSPDGRHASSGSSDTTALVWELFGSAEDKGAPRETKDLEALWPALESADARDAFRACASLISAGDRCLPLLQKRLRPINAPNAERLDALLADLDSEQFAVRTKAARELEALGEAARPSLRKLLDNPPSEEARRRAEQILAKLDGASRLRAVRCVEVLEQIGTIEAKHLLTNLADGVPDVPLTREAKAALERLARR